VQANGSTADEESHVRKCSVIHKPRPPCVREGVIEDDGRVVILNRLACEESHIHKSRVIRYHYFSHTLYKQIAYSIVNLCSFLEKRTKSMGVAIPPYPNAAQVWNAAPATNRGNFKPCSLRSRAGKISSRFSFLFRHLLACALLGDPWLSRHSPQSALSIFGDFPRTPFSRTTDISFSFPLAAASIPPA